MGLLASCMSMTGVPVVRKLLVAPESKMAHLMMVSMLMFTVQMRWLQVHIGWGLGKKFMYCGLALYYSYCLPLPIKKCCTSPDWLG
jgi:hypothetical protein